MGASAQNHHWCCSQTTNYQLTGMAGDPYWRKSWQFAVGNFRIDLHLLQYGLEAAAQNDRQGGPKSGQFAQLIRRSFAVALLVSCFLRSLHLGWLVYFRTMELNNDEIRRYSRHLILPE